MPSLVRNVTRLQWPFDVKVPTMSRVSRLRHQKSPLLRVKYAIKGFVKATFERFNERMVILRMVNCYQRREVLSLRNLQSNESQTNHCH